MITRIYIDNYKCFSNFEYKPGQNQLLLGRNGSGKSTVFEVVEVLRGFVLERRDAAELFPATSQTRWDERDEQTLELDIWDGSPATGPLVNGARYRYSTVITREGDAPRVAAEELWVGGSDGGHQQSIYLRRADGAQLFSDIGGDPQALLVPPSLSGLSLIEDVPARGLLRRFRQLLRGIFAIRIAPQAMEPLSCSEADFPKADLSDYASWYRHLAQDDASIAIYLFQQLGEVLDGFHGLQLKGDGTRTLSALIRTESAELASYAFSELSDGQRVLIALYTVACLLQAAKANAVGPGLTFCIDEPENYIALAELQPWIQTMGEALEGTRSQLLIASHHPEFINYYAHMDALRLYREGGGPVRIAKFDGASAEPLLPAELIARGWENE